MLAKDIPNILLDKVQESNSNSSKSKEFASEDNSLFSSLLKESMDSIEENTSNDADKNNHKIENNNLKNQNNSSKKLNELMQKDQNINSLENIENNISKDNSSNKLIKVEENINNGAANKSSMSLENVVLQAKNILSKKDEVSKILNKTNENLEKPQKNINEKAVDGLLDKLISFAKDEIAKDEVSKNKTLKKETTQEELIVKVSDKNKINKNIGQIKADKIIKNHLSNNFLANTNSLEVLNNNNNNEEELIVKTAATLVTTLQEAVTDTISNKKNIKVESSLVDQNNKIIKTGDQKKINISINNIILKNNIENELLINNNDFIENNINVNILNKENKIEISKTIDSIGISDNTNVKDIEVQEITDTVKNLETTNKSIKETPVSINNIEDQKNETIVKDVVDKVNNENAKTSLMDLLVAKGKETIDKENLYDNIKDDNKKTNSFLSKSYINIQKIKVDMDNLMQTNKAFKLLHNATSIEDIKKSAKILDLNLENINVEKVVENIKKLDLKNVNSSNLLSSLAFKKNISKDLSSLIVKSPEATKALLEDSINIVKDVDIELTQSLQENSLKNLPVKILDAKQHLSRMISQTAKQMYENYKPPITAFRINLHPSTLGSISILMKSNAKDNTMSITMSSSNSKTLEALMESQTQLRTSLNKTFNDNTSFNFSFESNDNSRESFSSFENNDDKNKKQNKNFSTSETLKIQDENKDLEYESLDYM